MHQQLACSVSNVLVVFDLSRKENNILLVYKDVSKREVVFQIKKIAHVWVRFATIPNEKDRDVYKIYYGDTNQWMGKYLLL